MTEFFIAGSWYNINKLPDISLKIGCHSIPIFKTNSNLGITFDQTMILSQHVDSLRRSVTYHIRNLWRIRRFIDTESCHAAAQALITSRLDYCNTLFTLLSSSDVKRLQRLQNSAVRLVFAVVLICLLLYSCFSFVLCLWVGFFFFFLVSAVVLTWIAHLNAPLLLLLS